MNPIITIEQLKSHVGGLITLNTRLYDNRLIEKERFEAINESKKTGILCRVYDDYDITVHFRTLRTLSRCTAIAEIYFPKFGCLNVNFNLEYVSLIY